MRRLLGILSCLVILLGFSTMPAVADHGSSPSDSEAECLEAGGTFEDLGGGVTTCAVDSFNNESVMASHPNQPWTAVIKVTTTTTYTTTTTTMPGEQIGCTNPAGNPVGDGWVTNPNCDPDNSDRNPGFTLIYGPDIVVTEHSQSSEVTGREQIGCTNHNGNSVTDWATNPNCVPAA